MTILAEFRQDESRVLDRLVDDALASDDRRTLLAALDDEPGAWRRCALAFLEAQAWRRQFLQVAAPASVETAGACEAVSLLGGRKSRTISWGPLLVLAASVLIAFGVGTRFSTTAPTAATSISAIPTSAAAPQTELADARDDAQIAAPLRAVEIADADQGSDQQQLASQQAAVAEELLEQFEQAGWEVTRQKRWLPVELSDGRRMVVPIEQVGLHYTDATPF